MAPFHVKQTARRKPTTGPLAAFLLALAAPSGAAFAQTPAKAEDDPLRARALAIFAQEAGEWASRWERLSPDGEIVAEFSGVERFTPRLGGTISELVTEAPAAGSRSLALRYYDPARRRIAFVSIDDAGDRWEMFEDIETRIVSSEPKELTDGRVMTLRFIIERAMPAEQDVAMHYSLDGGETWIRGANQYLRRAESD